MAKYLYKKASFNFKKYIRLLSILLLTLGFLILTYSFFPLISWQLYFAPSISSQNFALSIPQANIIDLAENSFDATDYTKAENWFKNFPTNNNSELDVRSYKVSIPKIGIKEADVSTVDTDLTKHLVNYQGTSIPGKNGNAVVFGHSTLPQLFNPKDYKTIFANLYKLRNDDLIYATINDVVYKYKIFKITIIDPEDSSALVQDLNDSYLTLVTCTPPGTIWKRLVVKARLQNL